MILTYYSSVSRGRFRNSAGIVGCSAHPPAGWIRVTSSNLSQDVPRGGETLGWKSIDLSEFRVGLVCPERVSSQEGFLETRHRGHFVQPTYRQKDTCVPSL